MGEKKRFLIFSLDSESYAIPISRLLEISIARNIQKDPTLAGFEGKFEFRGSWVPVLDIRAFFKLSTLHGNTLLVIKGKKQVFGMLVDAVTDILDTEQTLIPLSNSLLDPGLRCYLGILRYKDRLALLLNEDGLLP